MQSDTNDDEHMPDRMAPTPIKPAGKHALGEMRCVKYDGDEVVRCRVYRRTNELERLNEPPLEGQMAERYQRREAE